MDRSSGRPSRFKPGNAFEHDLCGHCLQTGEVGNTTAGQSIVSHLGQIRAASRPASGERGHLRCSNFKPVTRDTLVRANPAGLPVLVTCFGWTATLMGGDAATAVGPAFQRYDLLSLC